MNKKLHLLLLSYGKNPQHDHHLAHKIPAWQMPCAFVPVFLYQTIGLESFYQV
jgi:hypothetical protein